MTKSNYTYRTGTMEDLSQLQELGLAAYGQFQSVLTPENWNLFHGNLQNKQRIADMLNIARCFVCLDGDQIIGVAYFVPGGNPTELFDKEWCYIRMVGVNPKYRGQGIARALTQMCIEEAGKTNEKTIALHTSEFMDAARHIYESMGFAVLKELPPLFGKTYWLYTLNIGSADEV